MQELLSQLGIDWKLLIAQAVNFFLLLIVLRIYVYKPLLKMLHDRRDRIALGVTKAEEADRRLLEVDEISKGKLRAADVQAMSILKKTEGEAKELEARLLGEVKKREADALKNTESLLRAKEEESRHAAEKEAGALVRLAIAKTVELAPGKIDDALIAKAIEQAKTKSA